MGGTNSLCRSCYFRDFRSALLKNKNQLIVCSNCINYSYPQVDRRKYDLYKMMKRYNELSTKDQQDMASVIEEHLGEMYCHDDDGFVITKEFLRTTLENAWFFLDESGEYLNFEYGD